MWAEWNIYIYINIYKWKLNHLPGCLSYVWFDLSSSEFIDVLAMHYHRKAISMPETCDGCGDEDFNRDHVPCCKTRLEA